MLRHAIAVAVLASLAACGGGAAGGVAIRVGASAIATTTVDHWTGVMAGGRLSGIGKQRRERLRRSAAELLISAAWSTGEAAARGLTISAGELQRQLQAKERAEFPGGGAELQAFSEATGESVADLELEVKVAWAVSQLRELIARDTPPVTRTEVAAYYRDHRQRFAVPERREVVMTNRKTWAKAIAVRREMAAATDLRKIAQTETFAIAPTLAAERRMRPMESAMATARPHTLVGPVKQRVDYFVFEVKRIIPAHQEQLGQVSGAIASQLAAEHRAHAFAAFEQAWATKWTARTSCRSGYVVAPCRQYRGARELELGFGLR